jgi:phospholipid transport system substrate-binding protein
MNISTVRSVAATAAFVLLSAVSLAAPASAGPADEAAAFITGLADKAIETLASSDVTEAERVKRFREMFRENFAVEDIGKRVLGRYWRRTTPDEQKRYLTLFEDYITVSYAKQFASYAGEKLIITKTLIENNKTATVFSEIQLPNGGQKPVRVDWRLEGTGTQFKIIDLVVEGVSMSTTLNSDFGSIIRNNGGRIAGLLDVLEEKTVSLKNVN